MVADSHLMDIPLESMYLLRCHILMWATNRYIPFRAQWS
jgi:hypothetical protein